MCLLGFNDIREWINVMLLAIRADFLNDFFHLNNKELYLTNTITQFHYF